MTRCQHYSFAHDILPGLIFTQPARFVSSLLSPDLGLSALKDLWRRTGEICRDAGRGEPVEPTGMAVEAIHRGDHVTLLLVLPEATYQAEATMIAVVIFSPDIPAAANQIPPKVRYFAVEVGSSRMIFSEWRSDRMHINYGPLVPADRDAFLNNVEAVLKDRGPKWHGASHLKGSW